MKTKKTSVDKFLSQNKILLVIGAFAITAFIVAMVTATQVLHQPNPLQSRADESDTYFDNSFDTSGDASSRGPGPLDRYSAPPRELDNNGGLFMPCRGNNCTESQQNR